MVRAEGNGFRRGARRRIVKLINIYWILRRTLSPISLGLLALITGCQPPQTTLPPRQVTIQQAWELEAGDIVAGHLVAASLGDISIELNGAPVRAPFSGKVELSADIPTCVYFSSPEVPAYLFRFCGLHHPRLGPVGTGEVMGFSQLIHFATLRLQPDGSWALVEPSNQVLERALQNGRPAYRF